MNTRTIRMVWICVCLTVLLAACSKPESSALQDLLDIHTSMVTEVTFQDSAGRYAPVSSPEALHQMEDIISHTRVTETKPGSVTVTGGGYSYFLRTKDRTVQVAISGNKMTVDGVCYAYTTSGWKESFLTISRLFRPAR